LKKDKLDEYAVAVTPQVAVSRGADFVVVGRPIINADDPVKAAFEYIDDLRSAEAANGN
jgi:orotidine-5'-phosphate decarboxylase